MPSQRHSYEKRLLRVLKYIHDNPDGDLSLDTLADVAAMSRFHWHRVFSGMMGKTIAQVTREIRMHRAACWLVQEPWPVAKIAAKVGYPNVASFTRVFGEEYGLSPVAFRNRGDLTGSLPHPNSGDFSMYPVDIETHDDRSLAALAHKGSYLEIGEQFQKAGTIFTTRDLWSGARGMLGLYHDDPNSVAEGDLRSHAGIVLADGAGVPDGMEPMVAEGGRFAVLHFTGPYAGLKAAYDYLYGQYIPEQGLELRDAPAMEIYLNGPQDTPADELKTEVCAPIM
ncbi:MAG: AraC family transcriptional regulator [Pseudomonadota bacterium]